ncbi:hypothetical protein PR003_g22331 [Phytophthora rubi]|uniref:Uncharacterized protein n=1 Tax=Phytophthora rubi TaxID=129364 RepID=A0A6A4D6L1_9STRA|nr:hypothetical protein PR003_g22331 [Phytophthora rubi]
MPISQSAAKHRSTKHRTNTKKRIGCAFHAAATTAPDLTVAVICAAPDPAATVEALAAETAAGTWTAACAEL